MKKVIAVFMCFLLCLFPMGCNDAKDRQTDTEKQHVDIEKQNAKAKEALQKVLNKEQNFTFKSLVFDKVTEENLEKFSFPTQGNAMNSFLPQGYIYVDFDSDGIDELLIVDMTLHFFLILRYDDENVNGYILQSLSLQGIKTDGSFLDIWYSHTEDQQLSTGYAVSRVEFDGLDCTVIQLAYKEDATDTYQLKGKPARKAEVDKYFDDWNANTTKMDWVIIE